MKDKVRVRFAPSPTGPLHIGGLRTALFNYLFAKKNQGDFLLRIEDTDQNRFVDGAEDYIKKTLEWCGITPDESPWNGGAFEPYKQSERKDIYKKHALQLVEEGKAYYAFDTAEELEAMREQLKEAKASHQSYNAITRMQMKNSLTLSEEDVKQRIASGEPYVIRMKIPSKEEIRLNDLVRGWVKVHSFTLEDKILLKSDGMPTYHLANVVDDHLMQITHVIRGEEWLPSAPLHVLLYQFLGWEDETPQFAHLPLLMNPNGKGKLSKRHADKLGFSVFPLAWKDPESGNIASGYKEDGFLPDALINFLALLGWSSGTEKEIYSLEELIQGFDIAKISKAGAQFDIEKARWFNQQYIKSKSDAELSVFLLNELEKAGVESTSEKAEKVVAQMKERVTYIQDFWTEARYFYQAPEEYEQKVVKKKWTEEAVQVFQLFQQRILEVTALSPEAAKSTLEQVLEEKGVGLGRVMQALRVALTGVGGGPDLMELMAIIGQEEIASRIKKAIEILPVKN